MKINTKYHGEIEIKKEEIISFPSGVPGFLEEKSFIIIPFTEDGLLQILQSVITPGLGFVVTNPFHFFPDYDFELEEDSVGKLQIESEKEITVLSILNVHEDFKQTTANLQAPVVINDKKQIGKQVILTKTPYITKHHIFKKATTAK